MIHIVLGTRSEVIKLSSLVRELQARKIPFKIIHTGQHPTLHLMNLLGLPKPDYYLGKSFREKWSHTNILVGAFLAILWLTKVWVQMFKIFRKEKPKIVIYNGNTWIVPITGLAARIALWHDVIIVHRESGIRVTARTSFKDFWADLMYWVGEFFADELFAPAESSHTVLKTSNHTKNKKIICTQNPQIEIIQQTVNAIEKNSELMKKYKIANERYVLVNLVRSIDTPEKAKILVEIINTSPIKLVCCVNPMIKYRLTKWGFFENIKNEQAKMYDPLEYPFFVHLMANSEGVMTDSGGVIVEAVLLKKPCIVLQPTSQYPEFERKQVIRVTGVDRDKVLDALTDISRKGDFYRISRECQLDLGDGKATKRMVDEIVQCLAEEK